MSILDDIGTVLSDAGLVDGASGWKLYKSYMPDSPDKAIALFESGGKIPDQTTGTSHDFPDFQVRGRAGAFGYEILRTKMQAIFNELNDSTISGYIYVFASQSGPMPMGYGKGDNRPELSWNFTTMKVR